MERIDLTVPVSKQILNWTVARLGLVWSPFAYIDIGLVGSDGTKLDFHYADDPDAGTTVATTLLKFLNTANLSTKSLHRRILERLIADNPGLAGTIGGAAD
jgi:hypothetical protein